MSAIHSAKSIFSSDLPPTDRFDELRHPDQSIRQPWQELVRRLDGIGASGLRDRRENIRSLLREHGVTYNVFSDGRSAQRHWELGTLPLIIGADEWAKLARGLVQRTRLLNLVLADIYGPQKLLHEGILPPALLQANSGFLRPCHGVRPPHGTFLSLHAIDLTRAPDGQWWVMTDRTQAPSGIGYALENRNILSRILPDDFRACGVERLGGFFAARQEGLRSLAPWTDSPHVVLLTPGPFSQTYFEHTYLARHLGLPLVEGSDLTVRQRRVFLKTLDGLQPVDVIIRRVDDTYCDPLELRSDSFLGVAGLLEAARAGHVAISNALGSGAVESPAILAFLPKLARHLLKEDLLIPNVATWWCGQEKARASLFHDFPRRVIKQSFSKHAEPTFIRTLTPDAQQRLLQRIQMHPEEFVGQEEVALSTAPYWNGHQLEPRPLVLRCFVGATSDGFIALPGGLARVAASTTSSIVSSQHGGASMDTWVLSSKPHAPSPIIETGASVSSSGRAHASLPSRVVENFFWLGRYAERLEDTTRLLRPALSRLAGEGGPNDEKELRALAQWFAWRELLPERFAQEFTPQALTQTLRELVLAEEPGSIHSLLAKVGSLMASVRDRLSGDTWRILNRLQSELPAKLHRASPSTILTALHQLISHLAAFSGMEMENTTRGQAWRFLTLGRRIERALNLTANLQAILHTDPTGLAALPPLLEYADSTMTYRHLHWALPELSPTLALLLTDQTNPRSLAFQTDAILLHCAALPAIHHQPLDPAPFPTIAASLAAAHIPQLTNPSPHGQPHALSPLLESFSTSLTTLSAKIGSTYFSHLSPRLS